MLDGLPSQTFYQPEKSPNIPILPGERSELKHSFIIRVFHNTPFFELSYFLLTSHAIGLEEATKKYGRFQWGNGPILNIM